MNNMDINTLSQITAIAAIVFIGVYGAYMFKKQDTEFKNWDEDKNITSHQ